MDSVGLMIWVGLLRERDDGRSKSGFFTELIHNLAGLSRIIRSLQGSRPENRIWKLLNDKQLVEERHRISFFKRRGQTHRW